MDSVPWLSVLIWLPAVGAAALLFIRSESAIRTASAAVSLATVVIASLLAFT